MNDTMFLDFLETIDDKNRVFVMEINNLLLQNGCKCEVKNAKSGYTISYISNRTKRVLATFVCRKTGVKLRIYPQNLKRYEEFLNTFPDKLKKEIIKSSVCKRLINPNECNPKCVMGYDFYLDNEHYQKCRYMAFQLSLNEESYPFIKSFLEKEISFLEL